MEVNTTTGELLLLEVNTTTGGMLTNQYIKHTIVLTSQTGQEQLIHSL